MQCKVKQVKCMIAWHYANGLGNLIKGGKILGSCHLTLLVVRFYQYSFYKAGFYKRQIIVYITHAHQCS